MAAGEFHFAEVIAGFHGGTGRLGDFDGGDQVAGGGVRIAKAKDLALHVFEAVDARIFACEADGVVAIRAIKVDLDQYWLNRFGVLQVNGGIGRGTQPRHVERAAQQTLDHAVIVGRGEEFGRNAKALFGIAAQTFVGVHPVLRVFPAEDANAKFGDICGLSQCSAGQGRGCQCGGDELLHFVVSSLKICPLGRVVSGWHLVQRFDLG